MTTKTCQTCKHWSGFHGPWEPVDVGFYFTAGPHKDTTHGRCNAALYYDEYDKSQANSPMLAADESQEFAGLYTLPDHGCNSWEAKE